MLWDISLQPKPVPARLERKGAGLEMCGHIPLLFHGETHPSTAGGGCIKILPPPRSILTVVASSVCLVFLF